MAFASAVLVAITSISQADFSNQQLLKYHQLGSTREFNPQLMELTCDAEAAAYARALSDLEAARRAAEEAWENWYECEYGEEPQPVVGPGEPGRSEDLKANTHSILER